jgi:hypothetical protein
MLISTPVVADSSRENEKIKQVKYNVIEPKVGKGDQLSGKQN